MGRLFLALARKGVKTSFPEAPVAANGAIPSFLPSPKRAAPDAPGTSRREEGVAALGHRPTFMAMRRVNRYRVLYEAGQLRLGRCSVPDIRPLPDSRRQSYAFTRRGPSPRGPHAIRRWRGVHEPTVPQHPHHVQALPHDHPTA